MTRTKQVSAEKVSEEKVSSEQVSTEQLSSVVTESNDNIKSYADISSNLEEIQKKKVILDREIRSLEKELQKAHIREVKSARKNRRKVDNPNGEKKEPSGFNKPSLVPDEFCTQPWGCEKGEMVPRTHLTKMVYDYIKENNLQNPDDKRIIHPDDTVRKLFSIPDGINLEFKTFQTYMAKLYNKRKELEKRKEEEAKRKEEEEKYTPEINLEAKKEKPKKKGRSKKNAV